MVVVVRGGSGDLLLRSMLSGLAEVTAEVDQEGFES